MEPRLAQEESLQPVVEQSSLSQLDPSPMETPSESSNDEAEKLGPGFDKGDGSGGGSASGPGRGRGAIFYLSRMQRYSSYAISIFTSLHLVTVSLIPAATRSVAGSESYLFMAREIYQTPKTEPLLVGLPVLAHVGSGIALRLLRRRQNLERYGTPGARHSALCRPHKDASSRERASAWPRLTYISLSGYALTVFYSAHVVVNRILPLVAEGDSSVVGLAYVAHSFARHPAVAWLAFSGLVATGCGHMVWGTAKWLGLAPSTRGWRLGRRGRGRVGEGAGRRPGTSWIRLHAATLVLGALWAVGGLAVVARGGAADGWLGDVYDGLLARLEL